MELPIGPGDAEHFGGTGLDTDTRRDLQDPTTIEAPIRPMTVVPGGAAARFPSDHDLPADVGVAARAFRGSLLGHGMVRHQSNIRPHDVDVDASAARSVWLSMPN